jgi:hypothetical protein
MEVPEGTLSSRNERAGKSDAVAVVAERQTAQDPFSLDLLLAALHHFSGR